MEGFDDLIEQAIRCKVDQTPELKDLFHLACYVDSNSSTNYDVYDLATGKLETDLRVSDEEIQEILTRLGHIGYWKGPKTVFAAGKRR